MAVEEVDVLAAEHLGDEGATGFEDVRDDRHRREDELGLHELVEVVEPRDVGRYHRKW